MTQAAQEFHVAHRRFDGVRFTAVPPSEMVRAHFRGNQIMRYAPIFFHGKKVSFLLSDPAPGSGFR
jgi:hypothetical protein